MDLCGIHIPVCILILPVQIRRLQDLLCRFGAFPFSGLSAQKVRRPGSHRFIKTFVAGMFPGIVSHAEEAVAEASFLPCFLRLGNIPVIPVLQCLQQYHHPFRIFENCPQISAGRKSYARPMLPKSSILLATTFFMAAML